MPHAETVDEHVPDLTLEGLRLVYELPERINRGLTQFVQQVQPAE